MVNKICVDNSVGDIYHRAKFYANRVSILRMRDLASLGTK